VHARQPAVETLSLQDLGRISTVPRQSAPKSNAPMRDGLVTGTLHTPRRRGCARMRRILVLGSQRRSWSRLLRLLLTELLRMWLWFLPRWPFFSEIPPRSLCDTWRVDFDVGISLPEKRMESSTLVNQMLRRWATARARDTWARAPAKFPGLEALCGVRTDWQPSRGRCPGRLRPAFLQGLAFALHAFRASRVAAATARRAPPTGGPAPETCQLGAQKR